MPFKKFKRYTCIHTDDLNNYLDIGDICLILSSEKNHYHLVLGIVVRFTNEGTKFWTNSAGGVCLGVCETCDSCVIFKLSDEIDELPDEEFDEKFDRGFTIRHENIIKVLNPTQLRKSDYVRDYT